jgi:hypothetical protein
MDADALLSHASPALVATTVSICRGFFTNLQLSEYRSGLVRLGAPHHAFFCLVVPLGSLSHTPSPSRS